MPGRFIFLLSIFFVANNLGAMGLSKTQPIELAIIDTKLWEEQAAMAEETIEQAQVDQKRQAFFSDPEDVQRTDAFLAEPQRLIIETDDFVAMVLQAETAEAILLIVFNAVLREHASFERILFSYHVEYEVHVGRDTIDRFLQPLLYVHRKLEQAMGADKRAFKNVKRFHDNIQTLESSLRECLEKLKTLNPGCISSKKADNIVRIGVTLGCGSIAAVGSLIAVFAHLNPLATIFGPLGGVGLLYALFKWRIHHLKKKEEEVVGEVREIKNLIESFLSPMCVLVKTLEGSHLQQPVVGHNPMINHVAEDAVIV